MQIESTIRDQAKERRLYNLRAFYFELQMNLVAHEANGDTDGTDSVRKQMESCEKSYKAIESLE